MNMRTDGVPEKCYGVVVDKSGVRPAYLCRTRREADRLAIEHVQAHGGSAGVKQLSIAITIVDPQ